MKESFSKLKPFIIEFKPDERPLVLPSKSYPQDINTMPTSIRPCLHCGHMNEHKQYMGSVFNHTLESLDFVHFSLGFKCAHCDGENHAEDSIVVEYTCSCCGGFTLHEDKYISEGQLRWYERVIAEHGCFYFDVDKMYEGKCIADYTVSKLK